MGRTVGTNLGNRLADPSCATRSTLDLHLTNATQYHFSTEAFTATNSIAYTADLRRIGELQQSISQSVDRVQCTIQNVDKVLGEEVTAEALIKATAIIGRQYGRNETHSSQRAWTELFRGEVRPISVDENEVVIEVVNDLVAAGFCVSNWSLAENCQFVYKHTGTCGFSGAAATCNKRRKSPDGCAGKIVTGTTTNEYRFGGMEFPDVQASTAPSGGDVDPPIDDWPTCPRIDQLVLVRTHWKPTPVAKRVYLLNDEDELFNPLTGQFSRIRSIETFRNQPVFRLATDNAACGYSSSSHPIIRHHSDTEGISVGEIGRGDGVLTWSEANGFVETTVEYADDFMQFGSVAQIELAEGHIYAYSNSAAGPFIVCHNSKEPEGGGPKFV